MPKVKKNVISQGLLLTLFYSRRRLFWRRGFELKKYVLFAGVNGAGKTTLYQTNTGFMILPRVNVDETVSGFGFLIYNYLL